MSWEPGAWFRGRIFPQKCDLSPDGRWLAYSAHKPNADWAAGEIFEAISRLPWLHALAAWEAGTTYTRGMHFDESAGHSELGTPDVGDVGPCLQRFGLRPNRPAQFQVERRRGWVEAPDSPARVPGDLWDERRSLRMRRQRPGGNEILQVEGSYAAFRDSPGLRTPPRYSVMREDRTVPLDAVQWADWSANGLLLSATTGGRLQAHEPDGPNLRPIFDLDLSGLTPEPVSPPSWAGEW